MPISSKSGSCSQSQDCKDCKVFQADFMALPVWQIAHQNMKDSTFTRALCCKIALFLHSLITLVRLGGKEPEEDLTIPN